MSERPARDYLNKSNENVETMSQLDDSHIHSRLEQRSLKEPEHYQDNGNNNSNNNNNSNDINAKNGALVPYDSSKMLLN